MEVTSLGWRTDLMVARLQGSTVTDRGSSIVVRTPGNPAFWWGNFILHDGPPRRGDADRWLTQFAAEFPDAGHLAFGVDGTDGRTGEVEELRGHGLDPELATVMTATAVHEPPRPNREAECRELVWDKDWAAAVEVSVANHEAEDPSYRDFETLRMASRRRLTESGRGAWFGAFLDGELRATLGIVTDGSGIARFQSVNTIPPARGRGLAGTLVHHAARFGFLELGARTLVIIADADAAVVRVYGSIGFAHTETQVQFERGPL